jgi:hypothetical protein
MPSKEFIRIEYKNTEYGLYNIATTPPYFIDISKIPGLEQMIQNHKDITILPNQFNDQIISKTIRQYPEKNWIFCFKNIENFKQLITDNEIQILKQHGFKIFKIRAHNYIESPYQVIVELKTIYQKIEL